MGDKPPDRRRGALIEAAEFVLALGVTALGAVDRLAEAGRAEQRFEVPVVPGCPRVRRVAGGDVSEPVKLSLDRDTGHSLSIALRSAIVVRDLPQ